MIFLTDDDRQLFEMEVGDGGNDPLGSNGKAPDTEKHRLFFKRRELLGQLYKNFRKSQDAKKMWDRHRFQLMKAIKDFHHSPDGQKFHRQLDRFNKTHGHFLDKPEKPNILSLSREDYEVLGALKDYLLMEQEVYTSLVKQLERQELLEFVNEILNYQK